MGIGRGVSLILNGASAGRVRKVDTPPFSSYKHQGCMRATQFYLAGDHEQGTRRAHSFFRAKETPGRATKCGWVGLGSEGEPHSRIGKRIGGGDGEGEGKREESYA